MARIGYLMLRNGKWKEKQIIPSDWIKRTTTVVISYKQAVEEKTAYYHFGYGYLWWVWDDPFDKGAYQGAYSATGAYGQFITVLPKLDLVVAFKTKYDYGRQTSTDTYLEVVDKLIAANKK
jgi:CubicO group peptidase (beta-lactamase class C family)